MHGALRTSQVIAEQVIQLRKHQFWRFEGFGCSRRFRLEVRAISSLWGWEKLRQSTRLPSCSQYKLVCGRTNIPNQKGG